MHNFFSININKFKEKQTFFVLNFKSVFLFQVFFISLAESQPQDEV